MWDASLFLQGNSAIDQAKRYRATTVNCTPHTIAAVNGISASDIVALNPGVQWPCPVGTVVKVA